MLNDLTFALSFYNVSSLALAFCAFETLSFIHYIAAEKMMFLYNVGINHANVYSFVIYGWEMEKYAPVG